MIYKLLELCSCDFLQRYLSRLIFTTETYAIS